MLNQFGPTNFDNQETSVNRNFLQKNKLLLIASLVILIVALVVYFLFNFLNSSKKNLNPDNAITEITTTTKTIAVLPTEIASSTENIATSTVLGELEKYNFVDFYQEPAPIPDFDFKDYSLPLNVKIDALNYYDISRKINLDTELSSLNDNGFSILEISEAQNSKDFYSAYSWLSSKQVPLLITSDFLLHYHQNVSKQVFKDIEENVFYDNLWHISKILYESSRNRYEARLAKIGNINDQILEGERLATAYFAVALKLLEPSSSQIDASGKDENKFSGKDFSSLSFTILPYLQSDAGQEIVLIKNASGIKKSPVLLYNRNYADFVVPAEYQRSAKLYNFYLASTWLNSVFPLVIKDKNCPNCLLDKDDARLSLIASTFITKDFSADQELKNRWALIYKLLSYSKGLRDDLTYRNYDEAMKNIFGENYDPENIFSESNPEADKNLEKLRTSLLTLDFNASSGALNKTTEKPYLGFKLLSDYYYPNNYVFNRLTGDSVGNFSGEKASSSNYTICINKSFQRCNGFSLDIIGLVSDKLNNSAIWLENTNFSKYAEKFLALKLELKSAPVWHSSNFWSTLGAIKLIFENNDGQMQAYSKTDAWQERLIKSAAAVWVDLQLPLEQLIPVGVQNKNGLSNDVAFNDNFYIEPNYLLVQKLIADNEMIYGMLNAMGVNNQVTSVSVSLKEENSQLRQVAALIKKELNGETLSSNDQNFINVLARQYKLAQASTNQIYLKTSSSRLEEKIGLQLLALVYELKEGKYIAVGPIFTHQEKRQ